MDGKFQAEPGFLTGVHVHAGGEMFYGGAGFLGAIRPERTETEGVFNHEPRKISGEQLSRGPSPLYDVVITDHR